MHLAPHASQPRLPFVPALGLSRVLRSFAVLGLAIVLCVTSFAAAATDPQSLESAHASAAKEPKPGKAKRMQLEKDRAQEDEFFDRQDIVPYFRFEFLPEDWDYIHKDPRRYAECILTEGDDPKIWKGVAVKLKGAASFQGPDGKPGLSVSMAKYQKAERWNGFLKWHLNNGAQDNTFLNEQMSCEIARRAGVPASRCAHALVKWQGRDLGLYVFKESFDHDFLAKFYKNTDGDLYDGGQSPNDIHPEMDKEQGDRLRRDNVKELMAACQERDQTKRWERLEKLVDLKEYISLAAVEALVCHWDGYNFKANNYRLYFDADTGKASFWLHGTDQTFGTSDQDPTNARNFPIHPDPISMVGRAVMSNPVWKQAYYDRVREIYNEILKPFDWPAHVTEVGEKVKAAMALRDPRRAAEYENRIKEAHDRMAYRIGEIARQLSQESNSKK